ncbi:toll/interleukin-1 receptor domain-containing protein [Aurantiacibacter flavus]|uniref:Toll/interleukin-1 receptor domain-containing protein n=1 Tax=Aurantiacibacter flavus TaxID=3145232 RepID=A0ABV0D0N5_9SPHN
MLMASDVRAAALRYRTQARKSADTILVETATTVSKRFDIFLSHSALDKELVLGTKALIEDRNLSVYVDWIEDAALDRSAVDRDRADHLRERMRQCDTLFYVHTANAALSPWCPWELGYFDALRAPDRQVFVLPIVEDEQYAGREYLSLYDFVDLATYRHDPRHVREQRAFDRERFRDALGLRPR